MPAAIDEEQKPGENWAAVARAVRARMDQLSITQLELASKAEVSLATVQELARGVARKRYGRTLAALSTALKWPADRIERIAAGEDVPPDPEASVDDEINALRQELARISERLDRLQADQ